MKKTLNGFLLSALLLVMGATSCSRLIFEDRTDCPAFLFFDITNADLFDIADYVHVAAFVYPEETLLGKDTSTVKLIQNREFSLPVKRSDSVLGYGVLGFKNCELRNEVEWVVPEGENYDPLWRFDYRTTAMGERFFIPVEMVKDHSNITVYFENFDMFPETDGHFPFKIVILSNTCGINALTGEPVEGPFRYEPAESPGGTYKFTVPRQYDRSLRLQVWNDEEYFGNSDFVAEFNVWNWAHAYEDFSWTQKNLSDLYIKIYMTTAKYEISIVPWQGNGGYMYDL